MQERRHSPPKDRGAPITVPAQAGLGFYLRQAYRAFSREFHARLARHNVTHAQWVALWFLSQAGSLTPIALAREAGIQKASATAVIEQLRRRKLVHGEPDRHDRRKMNLSLTPAGAALMKDLIVCAADANAIARSDMPGDDLNTLLTLLRVVTANLEKANGAD